MRTHLLSFKNRVYGQSPEVLAWFEANKRANITDPLMLVLWNDTGLTHRLEVSSVEGVRDYGNVVMSYPATMAQFKAAIVSVLTTGPNGAIDLGGCGNLFQFPNFGFASKMDRLIHHNKWLGRQGGGYVMPSEIQSVTPRDLWEDVVTYCQVVDFTGKNTAVGPNGLLVYFN